MVSNSTIYTDVWTGVRSILVAASLSVNSQTPSINSAFNDKQAAKPQVVINPIEKSENGFKFGSNEGKKLISVTVDCIADKQSYVESLHEQVEAALKDTELSGVELVGLTSDSAFNQPGQNKWFLKSTTFSYDRE